MERERGGRAVRDGRRDAEPRRGKAWSGADAGVCGVWWWW